MKLVRAILGVFQRYFSEIDSPFNLAILRIVLFSIALFDPTTPEAEWFAGLPKALLHPPLGMEWLMSYIPLDPGFAHGAVLLLKVLCFFGLIGFFSRTSSLAAALCGIYVWGLPQLYGKVFHEFHILVWLMLLLALAPCAEVLSLDAVLKAFRAADRGRLPSNAPALKFGLPLRFTWLLMGVCYFYPGMWKAAAGPVWIFSNNLKYHLYQKWFLVGMLPSFRIDHYPFLCELSALATVLFELTFIFLVLFRRTRPIAPLGGLFFHAMTVVFMQINFWTLWVLYLCFINWDRFFTWTGEKLFPRPLYLLYDGNCKICRRTIFSFRQFDVFKRVVYLNSLEQTDQLPPGAPALSEAALMRDMHVVIGGEKWLGYDAYRVLAPRIPLFWPLWPFLWLWPVPAVGKWIYRKVADSRMCQLRTKPLDAGSAEPESKGSLRPLMRMGFFLLAVNSVMGLGNRVAMWPFACYPTFQEVFRDPSTDELLVCGVLPNGQEETLSLFSILDGKTDRGKIRGIAESILIPRFANQMNERFISLSAYLRSQYPDLNRYPKMRFYKAAYSIEPAMAGQPPISKKLLMEVANR